MLKLLLLLLLLLLLSLLLLLLLLLLISLLFYLALTEVKLFTSKNIYIAVAIAINDEDGMLIKVN